MLKCGSSAISADRDPKYVPSDGSSMSWPCGGVKSSHGTSLAGVAGLAGIWRVGIALARAVVVLIGWCGGKKWVASRAK